MKVLIVYYSMQGHTKEMATYFEEALIKSNYEVEVYEYDWFKGEVANYDTILLGCPAMGQEELDDDFNSFCVSNLEAFKEKKVGLFGTYGWGDGEWMRTWKDEMASHGIEVIAQEGLACQEDESDIEFKVSEYVKKILI